MCAEKTLRKHMGAVKAIGAMTVTLVAAAAGHTTAAAAGFDPMFFEGAAGGIVLGAFIWHMYGEFRNSSLLVDANGRALSRFDKPRTATITVPPYEDEKKTVEVFAIEAQDDSYPFKVWVADGTTVQHHPYYATSVEFEEADFNE
jgi:hypothetical protein